MRVLPLPTAKNSDVLMLCLSGTTDANLHARLQAISADLTASAILYDSNARAERLDQMARVESVGAVTSAELTALYSTHMSAPRGSARAVYDQIKGAVPHKKCPLCGVGTVAVLDHHLPKSKYPDLSILPANLVPACHFCNDVKRARYPGNAGEQTLHPYYDARLINSRWLSASLKKGNPVVLTYSASPPVSWPLVDTRRVQRHFLVCGLGTVFAANANDELAPLKSRLEELEARGGVAAVQAYLLEEAASHSTRPNSWQLSMYEALAGDSWFAHGGFRNVA